MSMFNEEKFVLFLKELRNEFGIEPVIQNWKTELPVLLKICEIYCRFFPDRKIYFCENLGKRSSYLTGAGRETFSKVDEISICRSLSVFIETSEKIEAQEKEWIRFSLRMILTHTSRSGQFKTTEV